MKVQASLVAVFALCFVAVKCADDISALLTPFCSGNHEDVHKAEDCLDQLPESLKEHQIDCSEEVLGTKDHDEILHKICEAPDETKEQMKECLMKKEAEHSVSTEDMEHVLEAIKCLKAIAHTRR